MKNDGILLGFTEWLFHKFGDFKDMLDDARVRKEIEKIKSSDAFKEYLKLPKNKRTLKKLIEIGNIVNTKDNFAVYSIWDAYKKETRVSNKELEKEIKETK
jgi:hypothetical protein